MKGLRKHILDFEIIPTGNPKTLVFIDSSDYISDPERPLLEITLPGYTKYFLVNIQPRKVNTFNSNTIGLTELLNNDCLVDLPDGAYRYRYKICPYDVTYVDKVFFRTTLIEKQLGDLYDNIEATQCSTKADRDIRNALIEIDTLITGARAVVCKNIKKANEFYQLALKLTNKLSNKIDKNCG